MLLTTVRHKSIELFTWLLCFLTFYLGFNQQVMCYELLPQGGIYNIHLQFIECDPLASYAVPTKHSPENNNVPEVLSAKKAANDLTACRDFHVTFNKTRGFNPLSMGPIVSYLAVNPPLKSNRFLNNLYSMAARYKLWIQSHYIHLNPSLTSLKTTILMT
jgi:hypothetical protein